VDLNASAKYHHAFFMEIALTFILVYVIFATAFDTVDTKSDIKISEDGTETKRAGRNLTIYTTSGNTKAGFAPVAIGFTLGFLCLLGGSVSGGAFNPARVFGPAVLSGTWSHQELYWIADFIGAALAGLTQSIFAHEAQQSSGNLKLKTKKTAQVS
jgi:glycerol uptake facilitator-like aquaporin